MKTPALALAAVLAFAPSCAPRARCGELIPPAAAISKDRPRLLLRPKDTPHAVSLPQLAGIPRDAEFKSMLARLRACRQAAPAAMAWLLTGEKADAERALAVMKSWGPVDTESKNNAFRIWFRCRDAALAYDWLHTYPGFTPELKARVRERIQPLAQAGYDRGDDHIFHNYFWMKNCGAMLWALAAAGDDPRAGRLLDDVRKRLEAKYYPAMKHLAGLPADSQGYWSLYCLGPGAQALVAAQSAFEVDLSARVKADWNDWLRDQLENLVHATLPNMRYMPWGDQQGGGDGGVAHEMACNIDMMTWATRSAPGAWFSRWLAGVRGEKRFYGETAVFYFIYTRNLRSRPAPPPPAHLSGGPHGGHFIAREKWDDAATIVGMRCSDCYTGHNHWDQGSFVIYRKGLLALDAGFYKKAHGPQKKTGNHNTLLFGGEGQRQVRPRYNTSVESYLRDLKPGPRSFETGNVLFHEDRPGWAAVAGEFGQAYDPAVVGRVARQLLYVRPGTVAVVDHIGGAGGKPLPEISWLLHLPSEPKAASGSLSAGNGKAWIRCRRLLPGGADPQVKPGPSTQVSAKGKIPTWEVCYKYPGRPSLTLVHLLEVGDGAAPTAASPAKAEVTPEGLVLTLAGAKFLFSARAPYGISETKR